MHHLRHEAGLLAELSHPGFNGCWLIGSTSRRRTSWSSTPRTDPHQPARDGPLAPIECLLLGMR